MTTSGAPSASGASGASSTPTAPTAPTAPEIDDRRPGLLDLGSEPGFAYVSIDGSRVGATPLFGHEVSPGMHRIEVSREGLGTFTVEVRPGQRIRRVVKLP